MSDFLEFKSSENTFRAGCPYEWPPPERLWTDPFPPTIISGTSGKGLIEWERISYSNLPDDLDNPHIARGARYVPVLEPN